MTLWAHTDDILEITLDFDKGAVTFAKDGDQKIIPLDSSSNSKKYRLALTCSKNAVFELS